MFGDSSCETHDTFTINIDIAGSTSLDPYVNPPVYPLMSTHNDAVLGPWGRFPISYVHRILHRQRDCQHDRYKACHEPEEDIVKVHHLDGATS